MCRGGCTDLLLLLILLLFSIKSFLIASHAVWLPIVIGIDFALSKTKNGVLSKRTTPHSPRAHWNSIPFANSHTPCSKIFSTVPIDGHWELTPKKVVHDPDFSLPHWKILRTTKMVFDDIESLILNLQDAYLLALRLETSKNLRGTHTCVHMPRLTFHALWRNTMKGFAISPEATLSTSFRLSTNFRVPWL